MDTARSPFSRLSRSGQVRLVDLVVETDGLVMSSSASAVLFNSAKLTPSVSTLMSC